MPIESWFSTPVYYDKVDYNTQHLIESEVNSIIGVINFDKNPEWGKQNHSLSNPDFSSNLFSDFNLKTLERTILIHMNNYVSQSKKPLKGKIINSWFTKTEPTEYVMTHNHGSVDMSGVYYFKTSGKDGSLFFMNPLSALAGTLFLDNNEVISYAPEVGKILLFPGWLNHGVKSNDTDDVRISISFNICFERI